MKIMLALCALPLALAACAEQGPRERQADGEMASAEPVNDVYDPANYAEQARLVDHVPFTQAAFEEAQAGERPILVDVYAPWCPVCAQQQEAIAAAMENPVNEDVVVFRLDFDEQKDEQRQFRATSQATLIAYSGEQETGRLAGETDPAAIAELIATTRG